MRHKTIVLALAFLLLPIVPIAVANQPNWNVELRIRPGETVFHGPCVVSTNFPIDVYLWNDKSKTGTGVYAFDFKVSWQNTAGISLVNFVNHIPWAAGKYFLVINETYTVGTLDYYHIAITAVGNSTLDPSLELGATGVFNASVVTLNFHIDSEPCWPLNSHADFTILDYVASGGCGIPVANWEIDNGTYDLYSSQPDIHLVPDNFTAKHICNTFTVEVHLSDITGAYAFGFYLAWNPDFLETDVQKVTICPAFAPPYEWLSLDVQDDHLCVEVWKPCEKPTLHTKDVCVVQVEFHAISPQAGQIPSDFDTAIHIEYAFVVSKCPDYRYYDTFGDLLYPGGDLEYFWRPLRADLNMDGIVDIEDLAALAVQYGNAHPWGLLSDTGNTAIVDVYDFVYVAKRYGLDP